MNGPRVALRDVSYGRQVVDLLFYDDVLAVVPRGAAGGTGGSEWWATGVLGAFAALALDPWLRRERERREATPATLPRRRRLVRIADVREVRVEPRPHGAARLHLDGETFDVPEATRYRKPWPELLRPLFGDRVTVE